MICELIRREAGLLICSYVIPMPITNLIWQEIRVNPVCQPAFHAFFLSPHC